MSPGSPLSITGGTAATVSCSRECSGTCRTSTQRGTLGPRSCRSFGQYAPSVRGHLVGQVDDNVRAMPAADGVEIVGRVPDVLPRLADGDLFVAPLRLGGGTRLKILEAFAAGLPVVATSKAVEGLDVENGVHAMIADDAPGLARAILALLDDEDGRERLALAARRLVEEKYDWRRIGAKFAESVERIAGRGTADRRR